MKFAIETAAARRCRKLRDREARLAEWRPYFAWWPTRLGTHDVRWLEWLETRRTRISTLMDGDFDRQEFRVPFDPTQNGRVRFRLGVQETGG